MVFERVLEWGRRDPNIRLMVLSGSRGRTDAPRDALSDYDVAVYVRDLGPFNAGDSWLQGFGPVLIVLPEKSTQFGEVFHTTRLVIYEDKTRVDFTILPERLIEPTFCAAELEPGYNIGYEVIIDKDDRASRFTEPTLEAFIPERPSRQEYEALVNEFWWETSIVAKYLWRGDLFPAKYSFDYVIRFTLLQPMLKWYLQIGRGWHCQPGKFALRAKQLLPAGEWDELMATYADHEIGQNWTALLNTIALFRRLALAVAQDLGYEYPGDLDAKMMRFIAEVRALPR